MATSESIQLCIDRVIPDDYQPARSMAERATFERVLPDVDASDVHATRAAIVFAKKWPIGTTLKCRFLDGGPKQRRKVEEKARLWEEFANVKLRFTRRHDEHIRISFTADPGSWSAVGTDCLVERYFPRYQPTMNYGWLRDDTDDTEYERVVVHEFGHALGLIHEHQSPAAGLQWNTAEVYRVFSGPPNFWTKEQIDFNILEHYSASQTQYSKFDPRSIMLYSFPAQLFLDNKGTKSNTHLSATDKKFIGQQYPKV